MQQVTLCYIRHAGRLLLIHKKRGLGAGKINGPGGKVEPGEPRWPPPSAKPGRKPA